MKDSTVMEIAVSELTGAVNQIAQAHNINPTMMRFVLSTVSCKLNDMAVSELSEEVAKLEIKVMEMQSKVGEGKVEEVNKRTALKAEEKNETATGKTTSVRKSGTIDDLIRAVEQSGVKVEKHFSSDGKETKIVDEKVENTEN